MIKKYLLPGIIGLSLIASCEAGAVDSWATMWKSERPQAPAIKVLIAKNKPGVVLEVKGKYKLYDPNTKEHISTRFVGKRKYIQALANGLKWGEEFPGVYQIMILPDEGKTTTLVDGIEYSGALYIYDVAGRISVVNEVQIEDYLDSVMSSQIAAEAVPAEALGAIAIANRTQAYYLANNPKTDYWAVDGSKTGYEGHAATHQKNGVNKALATTKYMVLTENDKPFNADFSGAKLALEQTYKLAEQGEHAAEILKKAFPGTSLKVMLTNNAQ